VGRIWRDVPSVAVTEYLERIVAVLPGSTPAARSVLMQRLRAPGGITWAPVDRGWALPHLRVHIALGRDAGLVALLLLREPLQVLESPTDAVPITRLLFFIAPSPRAHLELLAELSMALSRGSLRERVDAGASDSEILALLGEAPGVSSGGGPG
jgi:PTS system nitrogen regulatory IIA component